MLPGGGKDQRKWEDLYESGARLELSAVMIAACVYSHMSVDQTSLLFGGVFQLMLSGDSRWRTEMDSSKSAD